MVKIVKFKKFDLQSNAKMIFLRIMDGQHFALKSFQYSTLLAFADH